MSGDPDRFTIADPEWERLRATVRKQFGMSLEQYQQQRERDQLDAYTEERRYWLAEIDAELERLSYPRLDTGVGGQA